MTMPLIRGLFDLPLPGRVDVEIALEDISRADARSVVVASTVLHGVQGGASFELDVPDAGLDPRHDYTLTAFATRRGAPTRLAGTVAVHPWAPGDLRVQELTLHAFPDS
jgi:hypothetical protein